MVSAGDFRNGITFEEDGNVFQIVEFQHVKPGKGAAFVRTKIRNVISGSVVERTYNPTAKFPTAYIERREMTYSLYQDGDLYYFMDNETFEQTPSTESELGDAFKFVKENEVCKVLSYKGKVFGVEARTLWSWRSPRRTRASRATRPPTRSSPPRWRPARKSACPSLSTRAR